MRRFHVQQVDSTQLEARRRWDADPADRSPLAVRADVQIAGRGRQGRAWQSPRGGLWFSIALAPQRRVDEYAALPLVVGLSIARVLDAECGLDARIKWPNDVLVGNRKIAGVLCSWEVNVPGAPLVVGVGVNANFSAAALGSDLRRPATTMQDELGGQPVGLDTLFEGLLDSIVHDVEILERSGLAPVLSHIRSRLAWLGRSVRLAGASADGSMTGELAGIDERGRVIIRTAGHERAFADGELSLDKENPCPTGAA